MASGKPIDMLRFNNLLSIPLFNDEDANVGYILGKVKERIGSEDVILIYTNGLKYQNDEGTRGTAYWKVTSRRTYAVPLSEFERYRNSLVNEQREENENDASTNPATNSHHINRSNLGTNNETILGELKIIKSDIKKVFRAASKRKFPYSLSTAIEECFECTICKQPLEPPIICCRLCSCIVGCQKCVNEWYGDRHDALVKKCPRCNCERGFANTFELKGLSSFIGESKKFFKDEDDESEDDADD